VDVLQKSGESASAAQVASYYSLGGYNDWFLPSQDELDFMYKNLKQKNLGGFSSGYYWSSSGTFWGSWAYCQRFSDGHQSQNDQSTTCSVRAVRQF
jgi:hypothetical protein